MSAIGAVPTRRRILDRPGRVASQPWRRSKITERGLHVPMSRFGFKRSNLAPGEINQFEALACDVVADQGDPISVSVLDSRR